VSHLDILLIWAHRNDDVSLKININLTLTRRSCPMDTVCLCGCMCRHMHHSFVLNLTWWQIDNDPMKENTGIRDSELQKHNLQRRCWSQGTNALNSALTPSHLSIEWLSNSMMPISSVQYRGWLCIPMESCSNRCSCLWNCKHRRTWTLADDELQWCNWATCSWMPDFASCLDCRSGYPDCGNLNMTHKAARVTCIHANHKDLWLAKTGVIMGALELGTRWRWSEITFAWEWVRWALPF
jgi:hypothetical protein